ncbi:uncharacterized protein PG998_005969 [Apiospora kogelbergensis]|uniref:Uncharacterized protein n=1 Tax=Apiospora kogelbergensis TaxID=1337665 RepID=A0AAW0R3X0_9PEZI
MRPFITFSVLSLAVVADALVEVLLYETSNVCRPKSLTTRQLVQEGPGGPCNPIPDARLYTSAKLGQAGPDMRLRIYTYQGTNRCGGNIGDGASASSCVTDDGHLQLITGVGVRTVAAPVEEEDTAIEATGLTDEPGIIAYGYADGKVLHEIHRDSAYTAGYLKLKGDEERAK